jgi:hypothetical protein
VARHGVLSPGEAKQKDVRYLDNYEEDKAQFGDWMKQAAALLASVL